MKRYIEQLKRSGWYATVLACAIILILGLVAHAAITIQHNINAVGTVTINPVSVIPSTHDFSYSPSTVDFSGNVTSGQVFTKTMIVTVTNTSVVGTDGADVNLYSVNSTALAGPASLPIGWTLTGDWAGTLSVGASVGVNLTISSVNPVVADNETSVTLNFPIRLTAH